MGRLRVVRAGTFDTVQDLGRPGHASMGVPVSGAADARSLRAANTLVGNAPGAAAIEITLSGGCYRFDTEAAAALAGAEMPVTLAASEGDPSPRPVDARAPFRVRAGEIVCVGGAVRGARAYLAVSGGIVAPVVLGSASTLAGAPFGGRADRPLRAGDELGFAGPAGPPRNRPEGLGAIPAPAWESGAMRVVPAAQAGVFSPEARRELCTSVFSVSSHSSRAGLRLLGPRIPAPAGGRMLSEGMVVGAVQITESGAPIVLMPDGPTTGGYPVIGCVISADWARLGQLRPGDPVRFREVTLAEAWAAAGARGE